jgi:predicted nucleic acid-binding protein
VAVTPQYLVDNSAWNRLKHDSVSARLRPLLDAGLVATCGALEVEALYSARKAEEHNRLRAQRFAIFSYVDTEEIDWQRSLDVQNLLAKNSQHRGPRVPDLLIAAVAERHNLILLHYDSDFDRITAVTDQPAEWVAPRGTAS